MRSLSLVLIFATLAILVERMEACQLSCQNEAYAPVCGNINGDDVTLPNRCSYDNLERCEKQNKAAKKPYVLVSFVGNGECVLKADMECEYKDCTAPNTPVCIYIDGRYRTIFGQCALINQKRCSKWRALKNEATESIIYLHDGKCF